MAFLTVLSMGCSCSCSSTLLDAIEFDVLLMIAVMVEEILSADESILVSKSPIVAGDGGCCYCCCNR